MSGPIVRKYGFPNFAKIFGERELQHGVEDATSTPSISETAETPAVSEGAQKPTVPTKAAKKKSK